MRKIPLLKYALLLSFTLFLLLVGNYYYVWFAAGKTYSDPAFIPKRHTGLLLGTNKFFKNGDTNYRFIYRVNAAAELFRAGKIDTILISGMRYPNGFVEPVAMKEDLVRVGIPAGRIILDAESDRTFPSIVRCREVYGKDSVILISQESHNVRALVIAAHRGVHAIAFNASAGNKRLVHAWFYELGARAKMWTDLW